MVNLFSGHWSLVILPAIFVTTLEYPYIVLIVDTYKTCKMTARSVCTRPGPGLIGAGANAVRWYNMRSHFSTSLDSMLRGPIFHWAFSSSFIRPLYRYSCDPISSDCPNCVAFFGARYKHQVEVGGSRTVARLPPPPYFQVHTRGSWVAVHL